MAKRAMLLVISVAGTALWYGLAILGSGGFAAFFSSDARTALVVIGGASLIAGVCSNANLSTGEQEDRGNRWVLAAFTILALLAGYLPAWAERNDFWVIGGDNVRWLGVVLYAAGSVLRIWPVYVLGRRFSGLVAIQSGHTLVTDGIYRFIRNPSYLGMLILSLGWALAFRSGVGVILAALVIPPLVARMDAEEELLGAFFGGEYETYRARTARLIPFVY